MRLDFIEKLGDGAFADVWRARDELDREVAVKIVRQSNIDVSNALAHARALARATHPNVVGVLTLESTNDPQTSEKVDCVVMELINGDTLDQRLLQTKFSKAEALSIARGIIAGILHIHAQGMTHGDLHAGNVMIIGDTAKIIDILYRNSLASISTEKRESRVKYDTSSLQILLQSIVNHTDMASSEAANLRNAINSVAGIADLCAVFQKIITPVKIDGQKETEKNSFSVIKKFDENISLSQNKINLRFQCAPAVIPIYNDFDVVLTNPEVIASLRSKIALGLPVSVTAQISDPLDYSTLVMQDTIYQREDLIEAAVSGVEKRRAALERRITWCLEAITAHGMDSVHYLEECIKRLCEPRSSFGDTAIVDVVNYNMPMAYFKARLPEEVLQQISDTRNWPRPITRLAGCDLFDLPTPIVFGHVLPSYAHYRDISKKLPDAFLISEWWWGEA